METTRGAVAPRAAQRKEKILGCRRLARECELTDTGVHRIHRPDQAANIDAAKTEGVEHQPELSRNNRLPAAALTPLMTIARRFERVTDQAKNLCEEVLYMCTGEFTKHKGADAFRILFFDLDNARLSQMAEGIATAMRQPRFVFSSAGAAPQPIDERVVKFMAGKGIDIWRREHVPIRYTESEGEFVLGSTLERVALPDDLVARLEGKSSLGRLGLLIHSTAGYVDPGWDGYLTLELSNVANLPITLYPGMKIGQISFFKLTSPAETPYGGAGNKYQGQRGPTPSRFFRDFGS